MNYKKSSFHVKPKLRIYVLIGLIIRTQNYVLKCKTLYVIKLIEVSDESSDYRKKFNLMTYHINLVTTKSGFFKNC